MKHVVSIDRKGWRNPKLTVTVLFVTMQTSAAKRFMTDLVMAGYEKRVRGRMSQYSSMRIKEYRIVDDEGLKRLRAAAKGSITRRRRIAAKKAAATRKRNRELGIVKPARPSYFNPYGY